MLQLLTPCQLSPFLGSVTPMNVASGDPAGHWPHLPLTQTQGPATGSALVYLAELRRNPTLEGETEALRPTQVSG